MKLLLDTHSFLWFIENSPELSTGSLALIRNGDNEVLLSFGSLWEIAIKTSLGKLHFHRTVPFEVFVTSQLSVNRIGLLHIGVNHLATPTAMPHHHRDPFDLIGCWWPRP